MARTLVYVDSRKPVQIGDKHRFMGWPVEVSAMRDPASLHEGALETYSNASLTLSFLGGAPGEREAFACHIGAEWVDRVPSSEEIAQAAAILQMNQIAIAAGLPTYTQLETQLTELAVEVRRDVSGATMQAAASRAFILLGT